MARAFTHGAMGRRINPSWVDPLSYFSFQPVLHDWCNKKTKMGFMLLSERRDFRGSNSSYFWFGFAMLPKP